MENTQWGFTHNFSKHSHYLRGGKKERGCDACGRERLGRRERPAVLHFSSSHVTGWLFTSELSASVSLPVRKVNSSLSFVRYGVVVRLK